MADLIVPHFHNDAGVSVIEIGAREFMCVGALPPFDHPHVFLDMGADNEIICPYCSTLYRHDPARGAPAGVCHDQTGDGLRPTFVTPRARSSSPVRASAA
jgi:uncharacterized Zn-finger protein